MKLNRTYLLITLSSIALAAILVIQVNWILQTAHIKEELFNEKANMVLTRTAEALSSDTKTCQNMESGMGKNEIHTIDSLFTHYMAFYNFRIGYSFEVIRPALFMPKMGSGFTSNVYNKRLDEAVSKNGLELKLIFPEKKHFIMAEMGTMFITSVILILVVLGMFWQTVLSLLKEKKISGHTRDFLNNMAHEFKTPLTNIALAGRMIGREPASGQQDKIRHYSGIILEENEKLRLQVEQALSMSALERGDIHLQKMALNFHELIQESLKCISIQLEHRQGHITFNLDAERFTVTGDKAQLTNALCNLVDNAIKYSGSTPELSIQTSNSNQNLVTVISDKGIGIDKPYQKKVFDAFFRVPTGDLHDVKGFGLGLAYVKKIVELHGGTIGLESQKGKGSAFTITLPNA